MHYVKARKRLAPVALSGMFCLALTAAPPVPSDFGLRDYALSGSTVIAAPRDAYTVSSPLRLGQTPGVTLDRGTIFLLDHAVQRAAGSGETKRSTAGVAALVIDGGVFRIGGGHDPAAAPAAPSQDEASPLLDAVTAFGFEALSIQRSTLIVALPGGHTETFTDVSAEVSKSRSGTLAAKGNGSLRGQAVSFEAAVPGTIDTKPGHGAPLKLNVKSPHIEIVFEGSVALADTLQLEGHCKLTATDLRQTARWLGAPWPAGFGLRGLNIEGQLVWSGSGLAFDRAVFHMDGNEAIGALTVSLAGDRPAVTGTLALKSLDMTEYIAGQAGVQGLASSSWAWLAGSEISMPLSKHFDADVRVSAGRLVAGNLEFGRSAAAVSLKEGQLVADFAELDLDGARGSGQLAADLTGPRPMLTMRGKLEDVDAGRATSMIFGHSALQGSATVVADLTATGEKVSDLVDTVSGKLAIGLGGGRLGFDVKALVDAVQKQDTEGWTRAARGESSIDHLDAHLFLQNGVVSSERVQASTGETALAAIGTIDLPRKRLDVRVLVDTAFSLHAGNRTAGGPEILHLQGPWANPAIRRGTMPSNDAPEPAALALPPVTRDPSSGARPDRHPPH
jgi:AsmA protein